MSEPELSVDPASDPFSLTSDPAGYVPRMATEAALRSLEALCLAPRLPAVCFTGPPGIGKTLLLRLLRERLEQGPGSVQAVEIPSPAFNRAGLWLWVASQLRVEAGLDPKRAVRRLAARAHSRGSALVLLVDDAYALPAETLSDLLASSTTEPGLRVVLTLSDGDSLAAPLPEASEEVRLGEPMSRRESEEYLLGRLEAAGASQELRERFDAATMAALVQGGEGVPIRLNALADRVRRGLPLEAGLPPTERPEALPAAPVPGPWRGRLASAAAGALLGGVIGFQVAGLSSPTGWTGDPQSAAPPRLTLSAADPSPPVVALRPDRAEDPAAPSSVPEPSDLPAAAEGGFPEPAAAAGGRAGPAPAPTLASGDAAPAPTLASGDAAPAPTLASGDAEPVPSLAAPGSGPASATQSASPEAEPAPVVALPPVAAAPPSGGASPGPATASVAAAASLASASAGAGAAEPVPTPSPPRRIYFPRGVPVGLLDVEAAPAARIEVDGVPVGATPLSGLRLPQGRHRVVARFEDGTVAQRTVEVGEALSLSFP